MIISTVELEKALKRLEEALALEKTDITRDSCIQRFEFTISPELAKSYLSGALKERVQI